MLKPHSLWLILAALMLITHTANAQVKTAEDLIQAMQKKYARTWYKTATFVQKTTEFEKDGTSKVSIWYEALSVPGNLRIDFTPVKDGNGILFTGGKIYSFKAGQAESSRPFMHPLMVLGFDVYKLPLADVLAALKALKFDLSIMREDKWQDRPVYVVGAKDGDLHSPQFWIDKQQLYFVRMLRPGGKDGAQTHEVQFNKYQRLGGGWMAPEVIARLEGQVITTEEYSEMRADVELDSRLFDPQFWTTVHWRE